MTATKTAANTHFCDQSRLFYCESINGGKIFGILDFVGIFFA